MAKFQIILIRPSGYPHTEAFREVAETLQFGLQKLGHTTQIRENTPDADSINIFLGAHLLPAGQASIVPAGSIIYNLEQLGGPELPEGYCDLACQRQLWDYSKQNIEKWKALGCRQTPIHVPLGYVPELTRIQPAAAQDIDVLFYGSLNERRKRVLAALREAGVKVQTIFGIYGKERDELIGRSKIVLNIHFYEAKVFEIVRISYLLANSKAVVTESSVDMPADESGNSPVLSLPYDSLIDGCLSLLKNENERWKLEQRALQWFSQQSETEILNKALQETAAETKLPSFPRKLNLGSGKDWRADYFNVDCDGYWEPDAVLDFNQPLPIGQPIESPRLGTVVLQNDFFDEIIANDSLEHIPRLTTAMTSCLNLLRVDGLFRISVPYDLSWGAWQDPTHVRAFNERSWLYYTEWFWYMGWMESRFDLVQFELGLSPIGHALKQQGMRSEDLVRQPRAVDQLRVVLRKRLLTDAERQQVSRYLQRPNRRTAAQSAAIAAPVSATPKPTHMPAAPVLSRAEKPGKRILYLSGGLAPDYQCDLLFHGLRSLPDVEVVDVSRLSYLYSDYGDLSKLYGKGFTVYGLLANEPSVDRSDIVPKLRKHYFDLVIYGSVHRDRSYWNEVMQNYLPHEIIFIDGEDQPQIIGDILDKGIYFKRELAAAIPGVHPIQFAIPASKVLQNFVSKTRVRALIDPRDRSTYIYKDEASYYADYAQSRFAITMRKAGWDCLRHYEIIANNCIPLFLDLYQCPPTTMVNLPKAELMEALTHLDKDATYWDTDEGHAVWMSLYRRIRTKFDQHCTTEMLARYVLDVQKALPQVLKQELRLPVTHEAETAAAVRV
jgi:SAM-dependent methyltransferase